MIPGLYFTHRSSLQWAVTVIFSGAPERGAFMVVPLASYFLMMFLILDFGTLRASTKSEYTSFLFRWKSIIRSRSFCSNNLAVPAWTVHNCELVLRIWPTNIFWGQSQCVFGEECRNMFTYLLNDI